MSAKLTIKQIQEVACAIVAEHKGGIRYRPLLDAILIGHPDTPKNTISGAIWDLEQKFPTKVAKPERGLYVPFTSNDSIQNGTAQEPNVESSDKKLREEDFYESFAEWLKADIGEVTVAAPLGGAGLKAKWATPDVVGVYKPSASDLIKFEIEIVTAEIKIDPSQPVIAFGQAAAYRLFSTKTYIAMPTTLSEQDQDRLESLCILFGIGLALFDLNKENPDYKIRVRSQRISPDMFYVNEFAERLKVHNIQLFNSLFG